MQNAEAHHDRQQETAMSLQPIVKSQVQLTLVQNLERKQNSTAVNQSADTSGLQLCVFFRKL